MAAVRRPVRRPDPEGRPIDGQLGRFTLKNASPDYKHIWCGEHGDYDVGYYQSIGYEIVMREEGGAQPVRGGGGKNGEPVTMQGQVLMRKRLKGEDGAEEDYLVGQREMDVLEKQIHDKSYGRREIAGLGLRGPDGNMMIDVINDTTPARARI